MILRQHWFICFWSFRRIFNIIRFPKRKTHSFKFQKIQKTSTIKLKHRPLVRRKYLTPTGISENLNTFQIFLRRANVWNLKKKCCNRENQNKAEEKRIKAGLTLWREQEVKSPRRWAIFSASAISAINNNPIGWCHKGSFPVSSLPLTRTYCTHANAHAHTRTRALKPKRWEWMLW